MSEKLRREGATHKKVRMYLPTLRTYEKDPRTAVANGKKRLVLSMLRGVVGGDEKNGAPSRVPGCWGCTARTLVPSGHPVGTPGSKGTHAAHAAAHAALLLRRREAREQGTLRWQRAVHRASETGPGGVVPWRPSGRHVQLEHQRSARLA